MKTRVRLAWTKIPVRRIREREAGLTLDIAQAFLQRGEGFEPKAEPAPSAAPGKRPVPVPGKSANRDVRTKAYFSGNAVYQDSGCAHGGTKRR